MVVETWNRLVDAINTQQESLGIVHALLAEPGKITSLKLPGIAVWLDFVEQSQNSAAGKNFFLPITFTCFCIAGPEKENALALKNALAIAENLLTTFSGIVIRGEDNTPLALLNAAPLPIDIVEWSSSRAVASVTFNSYLYLSNE